MVASCLPAKYVVVALVIVAAIDPDFAEGDVKYLCP
jgi:hypothetical protein